MTEWEARGPSRPDGANDEKALPGGLFAVACPACGKSLAARVRDAGRGVRCPCCNAGLLLPAAPHASLAAAADRRPAVPRVPAVPGKADVPAVHAPPQPAVPAADDAPRSAAVEQSASPAATDGGPVPTFDAAVPTFDIPSELLAGMRSATAVVSDATVAVGDGAEQEQAAVRDRRARERRRARRSLFMLVVGSAILLGIVFAFTGFGGRR